MHGQSHKTQYRLQPAWEVVGPDLALVVEPLPTHQVYQRLGPVP